MFSDPSGKSYLVLHLNIRSLRSNFNIFISLISKYLDNIAIIVLSETWIYSNETSYYSIDDFDTYFCCRDINRSGGIAVYCKKIFKFVQLDVEFISSESVLLHSKLLNITVLSIYRSHAFTVDYFNSELNSVLLNIRHYPNVMILGDININILDNDYDINEYQTCLSQYGFIGYINKPTRINSCIDHIFVKSNAFSISSGIYITDISDHLMTLCKLFSPDLSKIALSINTVMHTDYNRISNYLSSYIFKHHPNDSLDQQYQNLCFILTSIKNNFKFPIRIKNNHKSNWINNDILILIRRKEKLYRKVRKYPNDIIYQLAYRTNVNELKRIIKVTKSNYFKFKFENCITTKQKWNFVNKLRNANKPNILPENLSDSDSACQFNTKFNNCTTVFSDENRMRCVFYLLPTLNSFVFLPLFDYEINDIINSFTNLDSMDFDGINIKLLKMFSINNTNFISNFINQSVISSEFPESLKKATITPIFKSGNKNILSNYRPISILPSFSKIIEKALTKKMYNFLNHTKFFASNQYGFIKGKNTESALLEFNKFILNSIDKNKKTVAVFLDIAKAFDNVNHSLLILKLEHAGFRGCILNWFISYLANRKQRVKVRDTLSDYSISNRGVPQGSILGPLLFLVFINDFCKLKLLGKMITYADDSVLLYSCDNLLDLNLQIEADLIEIRKWFSINDLTLNLNKTKYIYFNLRLTPNNLIIKFHNSNIGHSNFNCDCETLEQVQCIKYLGLLIDSNLKWKSHIKELVKKLRFVLYTFYHLKNKISLSFLKTLYFSWFHSLINYGVIIWGGEYISNLQPIISIQNKIFKILNTQPFPNNFRTLKILPFRHNAYFHIILYIFRHKCLCDFRESTYNTRLLQTYQIPKFSKDIYSKHFYYLAPKLFNALPPNLININNFTTFKRSLFEFLINIDNMDIYFHL